MAKKSRQTTSMVLTKDQFTFNDKDELLINTAEVKRILEASSAETTPDEQAKVPPMVVTIQVD